MNVNSYSLLFMFIGLVTYILVDQKVFHLDHLSGVISFEKSEEKVFNGHKLEIQSQETGAELDLISKELDSGKVRLKVMQVAAQEFENDLVKKRKQLKEIDQKIAKLKKIEILESKRSVASESISDLQFANELQSSIGEKIEVLKSQVASKPALRIKTEMIYQGHDSVFLTPNGILKVNAILSAARKQGLKRFYLVHNANSNLDRDRIRSMRQLINQLTSNTVEVQTFKNDDLKTQLVDIFEFWILTEDSEV